MSFELKGNIVRYVIGLALLPISVAGSEPAVPGAHRLLNADSPDVVGAGLVLISELMCASCHALPEPVRESIPWKPRQLRPLADISQNRYFNNIEYFIQSPASARSGAAMPLLDVPPDVATQIAYFVKSLSSEQTRTSTTGSSVKAGAYLYHTVGCVACHTPVQKPTFLKEGNPFGSLRGDHPFVSLDITYPNLTVPSIPIPGVTNASKRFLVNPAESRMPHIRLTDHEADVVTDFLITETARGGITRDADGDAIARGSRAFATLGCARCHSDVKPDIASSPPALQTIEIENHDRGCLSEIVQLPAANYSLSDAQRLAIREALTLEESRLSPSWRVLGMTAANNCLACHERDGYGGAEPGRAPYFTTTVDADLGDEGRIPPTLTGVGAKLTPAALKSVLAGHGNARPYMATRMPVFDLGDVDVVVEAFTQADRTTTTAEVDVTGLEHHHRNHYGRELMGTEALGCVSCHELNGHRSLGMPAIDLALAPSRLRPEWFMAYMNDPASLRPGTRMPAYFSEGKSTYPGLFNGSPREQIEAIWIYLREIDQTRLPVGVEDSTQYIVVPKNTPVVHRTFMKDVGARAIAVGFPEGVHFAFDATQVRSAFAWRGEFLDANSTWNDRFSPYVEALSEDRWQFPRVMPFTLDEEWPVEFDTNAEYIFKGYRLDDSGTPEFRYVYRGMMIGERITPLSSNKGLKRTFTIEDADTPVNFLVARGEGIEAKNREYRVNGKWSTRVSVAVGGMKLKELAGAMPSIVATFTPENSRITFVQEIEW